MLINKTKDFVIAEHYKLCKSWLSRVRGLMFSKPRTLVFVFDREARIALHMWFVFFPIDLAFLDSNFRVVEVKLNFKPFTTYVPNSKAKYIIEAPAGRLNNTEVGDEIALVGS